MQLFFYILKVIKNVSFSESIHKSKDSSSAEEEEKKSTQQQDHHAVPAQKSETNKQN